MICGACAGLLMLCAYCIDVINSDLTPLNGKRQLLYESNGVKH
jgi:hypothetical protein